MGQSVVAGTKVSLKLLEGRFGSRFAARI